jgi:MFS family permease
VELEQVRQTTDGTFDAGDGETSEATRLSELSPQQWRSGTAAWLGWLFDGLDMHLYTLVAAPVVLQLIGAVSNADPGVKEKSAYIQAAFLLGWALGGSFFGRLGDILGRSRALSLTILTYALCTGLCAFAQTWWQLMLFRFIAALGIGGEWAVGASLLSETWPRAWRPWIAAMLQTGVNLGILGAAITVGLLSIVLPPHSERYVFLVGVLPALLVFWIRRHVPEPETWKRERAIVSERPRARELFRGTVAPITLRTTTTCALALSGWWLFQFWQSQHLRRLLVDAGTEAGEVTRIVSASFGMARANDRQPARDRGVSRRTRTGDHRGVHRPAERQLARVLLVPGGGLLLRRVRALHDVPAAAVPDAAAHDRRGLLLQHRPDGGGRVHDRVRPPRAGERLPRSAVVGRSAVATGGCLVVAAAGGWAVKR